MFTSPADLPVLNRDLLSSIVTWAWNDAHPTPALDGVFGLSWGHHEQGSWAESPEPEDGVCGSTYCIAGQAAAQVGYRMVLTPVDYDYDVVLSEDSYGNREYKPTKYRAHNARLLAFAGLDNNGKPKYNPVGEAEPIADIAQRALGLNYNEREALFASGNSVERVVALAMVFAAARGLTLNLLPEVEQAGRDYITDEQARPYAGTALTDALHIYGMDRSYGEAADRVLNPPPATCDSCGQVLPDETL